MKRFYLHIIFIAAFALGCHSKQATEEEEVTAEEVQTPVTVTTISNEPLVEYVDLNATSTFMQGNIIKSSANGYIQSIHVKLNEIVRAGQLAFTLKTKEAKALGNTINLLDSSFRFSGLIKVFATTTGYISQLDHKAGDYVQDGEQLAALTDAKSFGFLLNLPYELRPYISANKTVDLELPDKTHLKGVVSTIMPVLDSASQTLAVKISVNPTVTIPQNLIAKVRIVKSARTNAPSLPKAAVLADEAQTNFWVMKMIDSVTAVKVAIVKGMESGDKVEILRPQFSPTDKILLTGNYGLADTAKVKIVKGEE
jgi:multidrug efflux pump subunit AcrA (membrane-fusion protein)